MGETYDLKCPWCETIIEGVDVPDHHDAVVERCEGCDDAKNFRIPEDTV